MEVKDPSEDVHVHRYTKRWGDQVISSYGTDVGGGKHVHDVCGHADSAEKSEPGHIHKVTLDGVEMTSGPPVQPADAGFHDVDVTKGILPDLIDPNHEYVFKTGEYGIYDYWYRDMRGNYWRYSNAPEDHEDFDPKAGVPLMDKDQPLPHTAPAYFTPEGRKRAIAVPQEVVTEVNASYDPINSKNTWYETYEAPEDGGRRYVYLDSDVRENLDLWVQYQLRITDAGVSNYRMFASNLFNKEHPKDKIVGAILMLVDQGLYEVEELADAVVDDLEFIDETVKLLGRKFVCDPAFFDFLTSLTGAREGSDPLFFVDTVHGRSPFGYHYLYSVFKHLRMSPHYILYWRASQMFSRVMNRLALTADLPQEEVEGRAMSELQRMFGTSENIRHMVDHKVREVLLRNYEGAEVEKALPRQEFDDYGTLTVWSDLVQRRGDEAIFSEWLHAEPMHDTTPEEEALLEAQLEAAAEAKQPDEESQPVDTDKAGQPGPGEEGGGTSPQPAEGEPRSIE